MQQTQTNDDAAAESERLSMRGRPSVQARAAVPGRVPGVPGAVPGVPRRELTPDQHLEAIRRAQAQAEHRVKLGVQLFKAAEAHTTEHRRVLDEIRKEQATLRDQVNEDVARTLQSYDQWVGKMDENFTNAIREMEGRIDKLQQNWQATQEKIELMLRRSESLLQPTRSSVAAQQPHHAPPPAKAVPKAAPLEPQVTVVARQMTPAAAPALMASAAPISAGPVPTAPSIPSNDELQNPAGPPGAPIYTTLLEKLRQQAGDL